VLGNALRNITEFRNPGFYQEDVKASKKFAIISTGAERSGETPHIRPLLVLARAYTHGAIPTHAGYNRNKHSLHREAGSS